MCLLLLATLKLNLTVSDEKLISICEHLDVDCAEMMVHHCFNGIPLYSLNYYMDAFEINPEVEIGPNFPEQRERSQTGEKSLEPSTLQYANLRRNMFTVEKEIGSYLCFLAGKNHFPRAEFCEVPDYVKGLFSIKNSRVANNANSMSNDYDEMFREYKPMIEDCPNFDRFMRKISGGDTLLEKRIWQALGYIISSDLRGQCFFVLQGRAKTGKSTLLNFILSLFDEKTMVAPLDINSLSGRFDLENTVWLTMISLTPN